MPRRAAAMFNRSLGLRHESCRVPDEGRQLAGDSGDRDISMFPSSGELFVLMMQPELGPPGDVADGGINVLGTGFDDAADLGVVAIGPGGFDEHGTHEAVAASGDRALPSGLAGAVLTGHQPQPRHEVTGMGKPGQVVDFGDDDVGGGFLDAAECLQGQGQRISRPMGRQLLELPGQAIAPSLSFIHGVHQFLEHDLLGGGGQHDFGQPPPMGGGPARFTGVSHIVAQEEGLEPLARGGDIALGLLPGTDDVAELLLVGGGNVDEGESTVFEAEGEVAGVTAVGFDALTGLLRDQGGGGDAAVQALGGEVAMQPEAARAGLVNQFGAPGQFFEHAIDGVLLRAEGAEIGDGGFGLGADERGGNGVLVHIQSDIDSGIVHGADLRSGTCFERV